MKSTLFAQFEHAQNRNFCSFRNGSGLLSCRPKVLPWAKSNGWRHLLLFLPA